MDLKIIKDEIKGTSQTWNQKRHTKIKCPFLRLTMISQVWLIMKQVAESMLWGHCSLFPVHVLWLNVGVSLTGLRDAQAADMCVVCVHTCVLYISFSSAHFSCSVVFDSLGPHGLQQPRLPCPSPTPGAYSNSCPSSRWYHPTISSSVVPVFSLLQSFPASGSFQTS